MAEYIDKNELLATINRNCAEAHNERCAQLLEAILQARTADVVPRSEVKKLQAQINRLKAYDEERDIALHQRLVREAKQEVARELVKKIHEEIDEALENNYNFLSEFEQSDELYHRVKGKIDALRGMQGFIEELEKKYIGEVTENEQT